MLSAAFSSRNDVVRIGCSVATVLFWMVFPDFIGIEPLENTEVPFPEPFIDHDRVAGNTRHDFRGPVGPTEVAAIESFYIFISYPLAEGLSLSNAHGRQRAIEMPLPSAFQIPQSLAVPDDDDVGLIHSLSIPQPRTNGLASKGEGDPSFRGCQHDKKNGIS